MTDPVLILIVVLIFVAAGTVKGLVGLGMPTISLGLLTVFIGLEKGIVLVLWPALVTNVWQAFSGGHLRELLVRLWPFLCAAVVTVWAGTLALISLPEGLPDLILGSLMICYAVPLLFGIALQVSADFERRIGVLVGIINGFFSGLTGSFTVPGVMYLQSIGLSRDELVQAMGLLFLLSTAALWASLSGFGVASSAANLQSLVMVLPALLGVWVGQKVRKTLSDTGFRRAVLCSILALGLYLVPLGVLRLTG